jgi:hypothetical protein
MIVDAEIVPKINPKRKHWIPNVIFLLITLLILGNIGLVD